MNFFVGMDVAIYVYCIDYAIKCKITDVDGKKLTLKPISNKVDIFQPRDPVVCMYTERGEFRICGGDVTAVNNGDGLVDIEVVDDGPDMNRRLFERFPTSMQVSVRRKFTSRRHSLAARNISLYGMSVVSTAELNMEELIDIDLIAGKNSFYFGGKVIWKNPIESKIEYGFQLTNFDIATKMSFEAYLDKIKNEYYNLFLRAR